jgi:hypothetical protein
MAERQTVMTLTSEVLPAFCRPMSESSISCLKNRLPMPPPHHHHHPSIHHRKHTNTANEIRIKKNSSSHRADADALETNKKEKP